MNARELIQKLSKADPEAVVVVADSETGCRTDFDVYEGDGHITRYGEGIDVDFPRANEPGRPIVLLTLWSADGYRAVGL